MKSKKKYSLVIPEQYYVINLQTMQKCLLGTKEQIISTVLAPYVQDPKLITLAEHGAESILFTGSDWNVSYVRGRYELHYYYHHAPTALGFWGVSTYVSRNINVSNDKNSENQIYVYQIVDNQGRIINPTIWAAELNRQLTKCLSGDKLAKFAYPRRRHFSRPVSHTTSNCCARKGYKQRFESYIDPDYPELGIWKNRGDCERWFDDRRRKRSAGWKSQKHHPQAQWAKHLNGTSKSTIRNISDVDEYDMDELLEEDFLAALAVAE